MLAPSRRNSYVLCCGVGAICAARKDLVLAAQHRVQYVENVENQNMRLSNHELAILVLLATSVVVRILPAFIQVRLSKSTSGVLERELPIAVFINFSVYIVCTEILIAPVAAVAAISIAAVITLATRLGLVFTAFVSSAIYMVVQLSSHA